MKSSSTGKVATRKASDIDEIIIHCSATPAGQNFTAKHIDFWHRSRGFTKIGYHYVVCLTGTIEPGRPVLEIGAHCLKMGKNRTSIGICYVGGTDDHGKPMDTRTPQQKESLEMLIKKLCAKYPIKRISGHRDYTDKACPCFDAHKEYQHLCRKQE